MKRTRLLFWILISGSVLAAEGIVRFQRGSEQNRSSEQSPGPAGEPDKDDSAEIVFGLGPRPDPVVEVPVDAKEEDFKLEKLRLADQADESGQAVLTRQALQGYPNQAYPGQGYPNQGYPNQGYPNQGYPNQGNPNENSPGDFFFNSWYLFNSFIKFDVLLANCISC